jgi:hypothetical protein
MFTSQEPNILLITRNTQEQLQSVLDTQDYPHRERFIKRFIKDWISPTLKRKNYSIKHTRYNRPVNVISVLQDEYEYLTDPTNYAMLTMISGAPIENLARIDRAEFYSKWDNFSQWQKENKDIKFFKDISRQKGIELLDELIELI